MTEELTKLADDMDNLLPLFVDSRMSGLMLPSEHSATFKALAIEAKSILDEELGHANDYSLNLIHAINSGGGGLVGGPSYASVEEAAKIVRVAVRAIQRKQTRMPGVPPGAKAYVDSIRIGQIQSINAGLWDFSRLVELCREINVAAANRCHMATAMLLRTILDHVPPILGYNTFTEVANNYGGSKSQKSFRASMQRLQGSLRNIADLHLHSPIRHRESVPTSVQVDFAADLDVLLAEIVRVADRGTSTK